MKYTIKKGNHSSFHLPGFSKASPASRTYTVNFSQTAWYEPSLDPERDWNKVIGWSVGLFPKKLPNLPWYKPSSWVPAHHWNSIRLVNRPGGTKDDPTMELALYYYVEGIRQIFPLSFPYQLEEDLVVTLLNSQRGGMVVSYEGGTSRQGIDSGIFFLNAWGYTLFPYAGGTYPAFQTYSITITQ